MVFVHQQRIDRYIDAIQVIDFAVGQLHDDGKDWCKRLVKGGGIMTTYRNLQLVRVHTESLPRQSNCEYWGEAFHLRRSDKPPGYVVEVTLLEVPMVCDCIWHPGTRTRIDLDAVVRVKDVIDRLLCNFWLFRIPATSQLLYAPIRIKGHLRFQYTVQDCKWTEWEQAAAKSPDVDTLLFTGYNHDMSQRKHACQRMIKAIQLWPTLTSLTIPSASLDIVVDFLRQDGIPSLVRLEVHSNPEPYVIKPGAVFKMADCPDMGLLAALRQLAGHLPKLAHLHWPVGRHGRMAELAAHADCGLPASPFPSLNAVIIGPFLDIFSPPPSPQLYASLLRPYLDEQNVTVTSVAWSRAEAGEFTVCANNRFTLATNNCVPLSHYPPLPAEGPNCREVNLLRILKAFGGLVTDNQLTQEQITQEQLTEQRADQWLLWYDWYDNFTASREAARKADEKRHDSEIAARAPGWKVLVG